MKGIFLWLSLFSFQLTSAQNKLSVELGLNYPIIFNNSRSTTLLVPGANGDVLSVTGKQVVDYSEKPGFSRASTDFLEVCSPGLSARSDYHWTVAMALRITSGMAFGSKVVRSTQTAVT